jgi:tRNA(Ile)-lysidine synthase
MPSSEPVVRRVARSIRERALIGDDDTVVVAVSGGADSVALLLILHAIAARARWRLAGVVHVNHGLRGAESDEDEAFVRSLAARLSLPIEAARVDVRARSRERHQSLEAAARDLRYAAFADAASTLVATVVATGHTQDDQAETVLLRLLRGAGSRGLGGIRPKRGRYVRPIIDCRRADLRAFLATAGESFREDASNADLSIARNRVRHTLLPVLDRDWAGAVRALARAAELAADDERVLARMAKEMTPALSLSPGSGVQLDVRGLVPLPAAIARRIVRDAIESAGGAASFRDIEAVRRLARAPRPDGRLDLGGFEVSRRGPVLRFRAVRPRGGRARPGEFVHPVAGDVRIDETGTVIRASIRKGLPDRAGATGRDEAWVDARAIALPLVVRSRRPGDRVRPFGAPGSRKLQDVLVDAKIPREARDRVAIVADARGTLLWVAGVAAAEAGRVTAVDADVVILQMTKDSQ